MKKNLLKLLFVLGLVAFAGACSNDETSFTTTDAKNAATLSVEETASTKRGTFWDGQIGVINPDGTASFTVPVADVKADLEEFIATKGHVVSLAYVSIGLKISELNPADSTYIIVGGDKSGNSVGVLLNQGSSNTLVLSPGSGFGLDSGTGGGTTTYCRGCVSGCNLQYVKIDGKKVFYCNENGCGDFCTKYN